MDLPEFHPRYFEAAEQDGLVVVTFSVSHINDEENIEELGHELFALVDQYGFRKIALLTRTPGLFVHSFSTDPKNPKKMPG